MTFVFFGSYDNCKEFAKIDKQVKMLLCLKHKEHVLLCLKNQAFILQEIECIAQMKNSCLYEYIRILQPNVPHVA